MGGQALRHTPATTSCLKAPWQTSPGNHPNYHAIASQSRQNHVHLFSNSTHKVPSWFSEETEKKHGAVLPNRLEKERWVSAYKILVETILSFKLLKIVSVSISLVFQHSFIAVLLFFMLQICPQNVVTSTQFHRYTQLRRHYIDIANCSHQSSHFFLSFSWWRPQTGQRWSRFQFNIYISLSTSLAMPWWILSSLIKWAWMDSAPCSPINPAPTWCLLSQPVTCIKVMG